MKNLGSIKVPEGNKEPGRFYNLEGKMNIGEILNIGSITNLGLVFDSDLNIYLKVHIINIPGWAGLRLVHIHNLRK